MLVFLIGRCRCKRSATPVFVTVGNLTNEARNAKGARQFVCNITKPEYSGELATTMSKAAYQRACRQLYHRHWDIVLALVNRWRNGFLLRLAGIHAEPGGLLSHVVPRIMAISADYPEHLALTAVKKGCSSLCSYEAANAKADMRSGTTGHEDNPSPEPEDDSSSFETDSDSDSDSESDGEEVEGPGGNRPLERMDEVLPL
jgi:hypothetical protein